MRNRDTCSDYSCDVYALTTRRDWATIEMFLMRYVDLACWNAHVDLMPANHTGSEDDLELGPWEYIDDATPQDVMDVALAYGSRAGRVSYTEATGTFCFPQIILTTDRRLIFGISVTAGETAEGSGSPELLKTACDVGTSLADLVGADRAWIAIEAPAPLDPEAEPPWEFGKWPQALAAWTTDTGWIVDPAALEFG